MADEKKIYIREVKIAAGHTISTAPFENLKLEASLTFGVPVGCTDEELHAYVLDAQGRLKRILRETYIHQKRPQPRPQQAQQPDYQQEE